MKSTGNDGPSMVNLYFRALSTLAGIPGTAAGQILCLHLGAEHNVALRNGWHIPEPELRELVGKALGAGQLEDVTPGNVPSAVANAIFRPGPRLTLLRGGAK